MYHTSCGGKWNFSDFSNASHLVLLFLFFKIEYFSTFYGKFQHIEPLLKPHLGLAFGCYSNSAYLCAMTATHHVTKSGQMTLCAEELICGTVLPLESALQGHKCKFLNVKVSFLLLYERFCKHIRNM